MHHWLCKGPVPSQGKWGSPWMWPEWPPASCSTQLGLLSYGYSYRTRSTHTVLDIRNKDFCKSILLSSFFLIIFSHYQPVMKCPWTTWSYHWSPCLISHETWGSRPAIRVHDFNASQRCHAASIEGGKGYHLSTSHLQKVWERLGCLFEW